MLEAQTLRTLYKVSDFVGWQREGILELNPNFQRRSVWKKGPKSFLIDTILRGFPIPIIFLRDKKTDLKTLKSQRDVVDGQQRIRTLLSFIDHTLLPLYCRTTTRSEMILRLVKHTTTTWAESASINFHKPTSSAFSIINSAFTLSRRTPTTV